MRITNNSLQLLALFALISIQPLANAAECDWDDDWAYFRLKAEADSINANPDHSDLATECPYNLHREITSCWCDQMDIMEDWDETISCRNPFDDDRAFLNDFAKRQNESSIYFSDGLRGEPPPPKRELCINGNHANGCVEAECGHFTTCEGNHQRLLNCHFPAGCPKKQHLSYPCNHVKHTSGHPANYCPEKVKIIVSDWSLEFYGGIDPLSMPAGGAKYGSTVIAVWSTYALIHCELCSWWKYDTIAASTRHSTPNQVNWNRAAGNSSFFIPSAGSLWGALIESVLTYLISEYDGVSIEMNLIPDVEFPVAPREPRNAPSNHPSKAHPCW